MLRNTILDDVTPEDLCMIDPLGRFLLKITHRNGFRSICIAITIHSILMIGLGDWLTILYTGHSLLSQFGIRQLTADVFFYVVCAPAIWGYYVWDLVSILQMFKELSYNDVLKAKTSKYNNIGEFLKVEVFEYNKIGYLIIVIIIALSLYGIWILKILGPNDTFRSALGQTQFWYLSHLFFLLAIHLPLNLFNLYLLFWLITRRVITVIVINRLLIFFDIEPKLFHPDHCNGLSPLGNYALKISPLVTLAGFWNLFTVTYPLLLGYSLNLSFDGVTFLIFYIFLIPFVLISPVWKTHLSMINARSQSLETTARQIRTGLLATELEPTLLKPGDILLVGVTKSKSESKDIAALMNFIEVLERKYRLMEREYRTWPFNLPDVRRFLISTATPLFWTLVSILIQKYLFP